MFTQRIFDLPIMGAFKTLHVMLWLTAVAFLSEWVGGVGGAAQETSTRPFF